MSTVASPLPLVFSHFRGHETFASKFKLEFRDQGQIVASQDIDSHLYSQLRGP